jgi:glutamyl-tRNA synthetase
MGEGNKKLSKRDVESNLFHHRDRGFIAEGLLNYLSLLGWSLAPDRDVFSMDEMVAAFDVTSVNPNPARFDLKKAESINGDHLRLLSPEDFQARSLPYLESAGVLSEPVSEEDMAKLTQIMPHVQERVGLLGEVPDLIRFVFLADDAIEIEADARKTLQDSSASVLEAAIAALEGLETWNTASVEDVLRAAIVETMEISPRHAFGPLRVAISGRRISPPLFESMEVLGRESSLARLRRLRAAL